MQTITPFLWFDDRAEEAARFYTAIFADSGIGNITHYGSEGYEIHGREAGTVMTVEFCIEGQSFIALNGGPVFSFNEAISFQVRCDTQAEVDHYWDRLSEGGDENAKQCGWLKDKFGVSWQIVPSILGELLSAADATESGRVMQALLQMKKPDIEALKQAALKA